MATSVEIDDALYSRQRYVLGDGAMQRMAQSKVFLSGLGGLGVEIAKNIVLAGIKSLTIQDSKAATYIDLGTQFFLKDEDVKSGKNRAEASVERIAELNPYVSVNTITTPLDSSTDLDFLKEYQCIILTEASLELQLKVNKFCRSQNPPIKFINADVYGVFCGAFCDFGDEFEVVDPTGEEPRITFISKVTKANPGVVTTLENKMHGLESGDLVTFKEVKGMDKLNGNKFKVEVLTPYTFTIGDTSGDNFGAYEHGGIVCQIKTSKKVNFESLDQQLLSPSLLVSDFCKFETPAQIHIGYNALHKFKEKNSRLPNVRCTKDADEMIILAKDFNSSMKDPQSSVDEKIIRNLSFTCQGCFAPLCAALGGVVAQEGLKALTGKFAPLNQWLYLDTCEVLTGLESCDINTFHPQENRYDALRMCLGEELCRKLADLKLFMVGCGAIGCEMLKNYALLGVSSSQNGLITITDNDLIEKSNLNRQFLFRTRHIRKPKSTTAAGSAKEINPQLNIDAQQHKVCPQTEANIYNDTFFGKQDVVVNALDNVEARRYMDSRCVTNQKPLLESGTMGAKGHVQVIVPHLTESYSSQRDPVDEDVPYCTLKSFPAVIEHCIQWARDKFESSFSQKPSLFNRFWSVNNPSQVIEILEKGMSLEGVVVVSKIVKSKPSNWEECVQLGRFKFEKYFNYKAKQLLHAFPMDTKLKDGSPFWQSPKRPPTAIEFDLKNQMHLDFVSAAARLYADVNGINWSREDNSTEKISSILSAFDVPAFVPSSKKIITDESVKKSEEEPEGNSGDELKDSAFRIKSVIKDGNGDGVLAKMTPASFEKDDDSNGHIDFITAASNLRASMYSIEQADRLKTKLIAGRIVPAIATTTAAVAGLVTIEMIKAIQKVPLEQYKCCFLNLALPLVVFSEPGAAEKMSMSNGVTYTLWDRWEIRGNKDLTLAQFLEKFKEQYKVEASMVVQGVKMVYVPMMPQHKKRLPQTMIKLLKPAESKVYADLVVSYSNLNGGDDEMGPPVRYYFEN